MAESEIPRFISNGSFFIKDRGFVCTVDAKDNPVGLQREDLVGKQVIINGIEYKCLGVEAFAIPNLIYPFGLLVGEVTNPIE